jgi:hypothetical protein
VARAMRRRAASAPRELATDVGRTAPPREIMGRDSVRRNVHREAVAA